MIGGIKPMSMYVTVNEFKNSIYYTDLEDMFTNNDQISGFLMDVSSIIDNYCGRTFSSGSYTDIFTGNNTNTRFADNFPIISFTDLTYTSVRPISAYADIDLSGNVSSGRVSSGNLVFDNNSGMIKSMQIFSPNKLYTFSYIAGYDGNNIPRAIKTATMMLAKHMAESIDSGNIGFAEGAALGQFKFGKFAETYVANTTRNTFETSNIPPTIAKMLDRFKCGTSF